MERRLAAILAADMVAYSRLMEADEAGTLTALKALRAELIDPQIAARQGRIVKTTGDGLLAEFASVVDAVACAVAIQRAMAERGTEERDQGVPEDRRIRFRIGINLGDIIIDDGDIYGDGVNIAARLEGLAEPGGICLSGAAYEQLKAKVDVGYEDLGEQRVKNIATPIRVYRVRLDAGAAGTVAIATRTRLRRWKWPAAAAASIIVAMLAGGHFGVFPIRGPGPDVEPASVERMAFPLPDKPSIAVLPFDNLSGDPEQDYWIDGTTEAVITALSKTPNLFIIARNSTAAHKGKLVKVHEIAQEFGVRYVLMGSIQRTGDRVRVNSQLVDALSGQHVWAEQFDRKLDDLFALQDDLTREVVTALEVELTEGEQARIWRRQTGSQKAYELFRKALVLYRRRNKADNQAARKLFAEAAATDPGFADANCLVGFTHFRAGINGWDRPRGEAFGKGRENAEKAIALDPDYPHAYALLGTIATWEGDSDQAIAQYQKSLELEPNYSANVAGYAEALVFAGRGAEAVEQIERAMRLSPYYTHWYLLVAGNAYRLAGRMDDALAAYEKRVERAPKSFIAKLWLAGYYAELGRQSDAAAMMAKVLQQAPWISRKFAARFLPYKAAAEREAVIDTLRKAGLPENPPLKLPDKPSIAVLPFTNMSGDAEQEYFADGMTEDIITDLSKISGLFVIARNSSFQYKGKSPDLREVGRALGVKYLLEGSVRRAGEAVRINAQLVDAGTGGHLWAERYDGDLKDVFALQDKVTQQIVAALKVELTAADEKILEHKSRPVNLEAYDWLLKGRKQLADLDREKAALAKVFFERAIKADPTYARAYTNLGFYYWNEWRLWGLDRAKNLEMALQIGQKAVELDPQSAGARVLLALAHQFRGEHAEADKWGNEALDLHPTQAETLGNLGAYLRHANRYEEAVEVLEKAMRLDPLHPPPWLAWLGLVYFHLGEAQKAIEVLREGVAREPDYIAFHVFLAASYVVAGDKEKAEAEGREVLRLNNRFTVSAQERWSSVFTKDASYVRRVGVALREAGLPE